MNRETELLINIYVDHIRDLYKDSDEIVTYTTTYYNNHQYTETVQLAYCTCRDLQNMLFTDAINVQDLNLQLTEREKNIYNAILLRSRYNYDLAYTCYMYSLYLNDKDKNIFRTNLLQNYCGILTIFDDIKLKDKLQLTIEEKNQLFHRAIFNAYNIDRILISYYNDLTEGHKHDILQCLLVNPTEANVCLTNKAIPIDFRINLFNYVYTTDDFTNLFDRFCDRHLDDAIRISIFNYLIENDNIDFSFFNIYLKDMNERELALVCNKFYANIFGNTSSFKDFYRYCLIFSKWLRKNERLLLIKKLQARTRNHLIPVVIDSIIFPTEELDILKAMNLKNKL